MFKKNVWILPSLLLCSCSSFAAQTANERALSTALTAAATMVNATTPKMIDEETRIDSAATFKNFIIYNNTMVNYTAQQLDITLFDSLIQETVIDPLCANEKLSGFIELDVVMVYRYLGKNGEFISEIAKDMSTCEDTK